MKPSAIRLCRILSRLFLAGAVLAPAGAVLLFWNLEWTLSALSGQVFSGLADSLPINGPITWATKGLGLAAVALPTGLTSVLLWKLSRLFQSCGQGYIFTQDNVRRIRQVGMLLLVREAFMPVEGALLSVILTMHNPPGERMLSISLSSANLTAVVTALTIIVAAHVLDQARELHEEARLTI